MIAKHDLLRVKTRALRLNVWFKALSKTERAIINLTMKCVERVRSNFLETVISSIIDKILKALECQFLFKAEKAGREIAKQVGQIALKWGHKNAPVWELEIDFIRFLGVNILNQ